MDKKAKSTKEQYRSIKLEGNDILFTSDVDWASEYMLQYFIDFINELGIKPLMFCTHKSKVIEEKYNAGEISVGIHPNYRNRSSHGSTINDVTKYISSLFPHSKISRSHGFVDSCEIQSSLKENGIIYDSNEMMQDKAKIKISLMKSGIYRLPCFWSDGMVVHKTSNLDYKIKDACDFTMQAIQTSGYKILNVHPILFVNNCYSIKHYKKYREKTREFDCRDLAMYNNNNYFGVRDYFFKIIESKKKFSTAEDIFL